MISRCPHCRAELGPAENRRGCLICRAARLTTNPDRVVAVLEESRSPLAYWDVKRLLEAQDGRRVHQGSLLVWLSADQRACWGGPGIYGLYRHGLLPFVRDLGAVAAVFLHSLGRGVSQDEVSFVLRSAGYRFQSTSIYLALRRVEDAGLVSRRWGRWGPTDASIETVVGVLHRSDIDSVVQRAATQAQEALAELQRRLS